MTDLNLQPSVRVLRDACTRATEFVAYDDKGILYSRPLEKLLDGQPAPFVYRFTADRSFSDLRMAFVDSDGEFMFNSVEGLYGYSGDIVTYDYKGMKVVV